MADQKTDVQVSFDVGSRLGECWIRFTAPGVSPITIPMEPQAAFEMGEKLARAAHTAKFGKAPEEADGAYLMSQVKSRVTEDLRKMLIQRISVMFNSTRFDKAWSNPKLAAEVVDNILTKTA